MKRIYDLLTIIPNKQITELNDLIKAGGLFVPEKIGVLQMNMNRKLKLGWKIKLEIHIRNLRQQVKMLRSSSSSYRAGSTDIPDPLSPLLPIVHRSRLVFRTTPCILT